jgi:nitrate reductase gamma subunit
MATDAAATAANVVTAAADAVTAATGAATNAADAVTAATAAAGAATDVVSGASSLPPSGAALIFAKVEWLLMVPMVYLSLAFLVVALAWKLFVIFRTPPPYSLAIYPAKKRPFLAALSDTFAMPQIRKRRPVFWVFLMLYHAAFLLLILGHFDILSSVNIVRAESKHMLGAGFVGVAVTVPVFFFLARRFSGEQRKISAPSDYLLLFLLLFIFLLGDMISWGNSWTAHGFVMTKADFAEYFDGLMSFSFADPRAFLHGSHYHIVVLHVFLAELFFIVLPFSKVTHTFLSLPVNLLRRKPWIQR